MESIRDFASITLQIRDFNDKAKLEDLCLLAYTKPSLRRFDSGEKDYGIKVNMEKPFQYARPRQ